MKEEKDMRATWEKDELVERYCLGALSADELRVFEQWKNSDPALASAIEEYRFMASVFGVYASRLELRNQISQISEEFETDMFRFPATLRRVDTRQAERPGLIRRMWRQHKLASVAAALALVTLFSSVFSLLIGKWSDKGHQNDFQELRRQVESIRRSQNALRANLSQPLVPGEKLEQGFSGTCFAVSPKGYLLTSYHLVKDAKSIYISYSDTLALKATIFRSEPQLDLAILRVDDPSFEGFDDVPFSLRKGVADPGEKVFTLGFPREDMVYGEGSVSSSTGYEGDTVSYQISIPVNPGNSGGPLFDNQANLLGIISGRNSSAEGASFAIQSKWIHDFIEKESGDSLKLSTRRNLKGMERSSQIKKLKDCIYMVRIYN